MQVSNVFSALAGAERVFAVMDEEPEPEDDPDAVSMEGMKGHVSLEHVYFGYDPGKLILKDISLYARPGQKIAFVGSTGAGKTTITNLLNRFYDIQSGSITIDGVDVRPYKAGGAAEEHCRGAPGHPSVYGNGHGKYPVRTAGRHGRRGDPGGENGVGPFLYHASSQGL